MGEVGRGTWFPVPGVCFCLTPNVVQAPDQLLDAWRRALLSSAIPDGFECRIDGVISAVDGQRELGDVPI